MSASAFSPTHSGITSPAPAPGPAGAVLVVEDEDALALLVTRLLQRLGRAVFYAADGEQARRLIREHGAELALALVDCGLPDMSGAELCAEIRAALPSLPLLLTSGRDQTALAAALSAGGPAAFMTKPFLPTELAERMGGLLTPTA